ncbi:MAG: isoleucine--tRNA ligase [Acidobacteria bacterium]|nr:isoleucine--tRNA ligase [Acidobacteriota bacterium]
MSRFKEVPAKTDFPSLEEEVLSFWDQHRVFEKSLEQREGAERYVFYDGPPFATGLPHYGHLLAGTIKDIVPRYWTMQGKYVERRFGWDCHGLPVENEAAKDLKEKEGLDLSGKYEIEAYGVDRFNEYCRSIVQKYTAEWEVVVRRMGRWVDFRNHYRTMDRDFMESIWWVFKQLWEKDLVYEGYRVMPFSWKLSTPLSNFEANMNYQMVQDPAITVRFQLEDSPNTWILAWTTTPWTLPSNLGLAVGPDMDYVTVEDGEDRYILAEARLEHYRSHLKKELRVVATCKGSDLLGRAYCPLFPYFKTLVDQGAFRVLSSSDVSTEDGTGIVHMAPAYGEVDFQVCQDHQIPLVDPVDMEGRFTDEVVDFAGQHVKDADRHIIRTLKESGSLLHHGTIEHSYPFCWRSNTPLIYKAISTWFVKVEQLKDRLMANNDQIHWVPESIGSNRFGNWLANARDWNISRNRYWGTPIPLWRSDDGDLIALGSVAELEEATGEAVPDLHSHFIDGFEIVRNGKKYRRIPEVFDCWFESGSMPYAQNHYPFENKEVFEANFPADFIAEGLDQTRGWFYTLTVLSTALFDKPAFKNVIVNGLILAEDGQKMSKQKKNYPDPMEVIHQYGADCLRSYLIDSPVVRAEPLRFQEKGIVQIFRKVVSPFWNAYSFFVTYANLDDYQPQPSLTDSRNDLDRWIISKFQTLVSNVTQHMEGSYLYNVIPELEEFVDLMTNWYIRRSRRRFWRADNDRDKQDAYNTLYYVLTEFSKVMAPCLPFTCEAIYQNLVRRVDKEAPLSVHLCDYPRVQASLVRSNLESDMQLARTIVNIGRSLRAKHDLKVRQPLRAMSVVVPSDQREAVKRLAEVVEEELNIKGVEVLEDETELVTYSARPNLKVLGPRLGKALRDVGAGVRALSHKQLAAFLRDNRIVVAGHELSGDDLLIDRQEREETVVLSENDVVVALDTHLTPELLLEGDARELVNRIQNARKEAGYRVEDRIMLEIAGEWTTELLRVHGDEIARETLSVSMDQGFDPDATHTWNVNGKDVTVRMRRA